MSQKLKLREAVSNIFQDIIKDGIKSLVKSMANAILNIYGSYIILALMGILLSALPWLKIPITIPAFIAAGAIGLAMVAVLFFQSLQRRIRSQRLTSIVLHGLCFQLAQDRTIIGPLCTKCRALMRVVFDQDENVTRVVFGKDAIYKYNCTCGNEVVLSEPLGELQNQVREHFQKAKFAQSDTRSK